MSFATRFSREWSKLWRPFAADVKEVDRDIWFVPRAYGVLSLVVFLGRVGRVAFYLPVVIYPVILFVPAKASLWSALP